MRADNFDMSCFSMLELKKCNVMFQNKYKIWVQSFLMVVLSK